MKTTITITMLVGIFLISLCSAIYPGETQNITIGVQYFHNYTITNNVSYIPINISLDNSTATIYIPTDYPLNTFTLTFYGERDVQEATIVLDETINRGGGGGICSWTCGAWSSCVNGNQTRTCTKRTKYCYAKPVPLIQNCTEVIILTPVNQTEVIVPPTNKPFPWMWVLGIGGVLLVGILIWFFARSDRY